MDPFSRPVGSPVPEADRPPDASADDGPGSGPIGIAPGEPAAGGSGSRSHSLRVVAEWVGLILLAFIIAIVIKTFLFQAFYIPSESMVPTLKVHDRVLVNKLSYKLHPVHRGDIVVFTAPPDTDPGINDLVKRVIGLPGDTVSAHGGHIYIDGKELPEPYLPKGTYTSDFSDRKLAPNSYWVMGDNRGNSKDSRAFGPITKGKIVGRVFVRIWPLDRLGLM